MQNKNTNWTNDIEHIVNAIMQGVQSGEVDKDFLKGKNYKHSDLVEFLDNISDEKKFTLQHKNANEAYSKRDVESLMRKLHKEKKRRNTIRITSIASSVVAAILFISFWVLNMEDRPESIATSMISNPIELANVNMPTLVVDDSELINVITGKTDKTGKIYTEKFIKNDNLAVQTLNKLLVPVGYSEIVVLPDGTEVTLNAKSSIEYPSIFSDSCREVRVRGEAYFKVTKSTVPFIVNAKDAVVKVYGTSFNVNSRDTSLVQVVLVEGSVGVGTKTQQITMLKPNQMAEINSHTTHCEVAEVDVRPYIAWQAGKFDFDDVNIEKLIEELELWYGIDIIYHPEQFKDLNINMSFSRKLEMDKVSNIIEESLGLILIREGGRNYSLVQK